MRPGANGTAIVTCAAVAVLIGSSVLVGWAFHVRILVTWLPGFVSLKANTAAGDLAIVDTARVLRATFRDGDVVAARPRPEAGYRRRRATLTAARVGRWTSQGMGRTRPLATGSATSSGDPDERPIVTRRSWAIETT